MNSFLAALAALPRLATALESLVKTLDTLNSKASKARASARRKHKDDEVDQNIADVLGLAAGGVPDAAAGERRTPDGSPRVSSGGESGSSVHR